MVNTSKVEELRERILDTDGRDAAPFGAFAENRELLDAFVKAVREEQASIIEKYFSEHNIPKFGPCSCPACNLVRDQYKDTVNG